MGAVEALPALEKLLDDLGRDTRVAAAIALARLGSPKGARVLIEEEQGFRFLNAVRQPELWKGLASRRLAEPARSASLARVARATGLELDLSRAPHGDRPHWSFDPDLTGDPESALSAIEGAECEAYDVVLEPGKLRILPRPEAARFWADWRRPMD
jgi:hypothetical protein